MKAKRFIPVILLVSFMVSFQGINQNIPDVKNKISSVIKNSIEWAINKDLKLLYSSMAQDSAFFIFNPDSAGSIEGFDAFRKMAEDVFMNDAFKATGSVFRDLKIHLSESKTVAWFSCFLDDFGEWNAKPIGWINTRWTGVLEKREEDWVIVQMHFSFPCDRKSLKD